MKWISIIFFFALQYVSVAMAVSGNYLIAIPGFIIAADMLLVAARAHHLDLFRKRAANDSIVQSSYVRTISLFYAPATDWSEFFKVDKADSVISSTYRSLRLSNLVMLVFWASLVAAGMISGNFINILLGIIFGASGIREKRVLAERAERFEKSTSSNPV